MLSLKTHKQVTLCGLNKKTTDADIYLYEIIISLKKRGHRFEEEQGGVYERVWREKGERRNIVIRS